MLEVTGIISPKQTCLKGEFIFLLGRVVVDSCQDLRSKDCQ